MVSIDLEDNRTVLEAAPKHRSAPKSLPLPDCLSRSNVPRFPSPFQVEGPSSIASTPTMRTGVVPTQRGLAAPVAQPTFIDSLTMDSHSHVGIPAPQFTQDPPASHCLHVSNDASSGRDLANNATSGVERPMKVLKLHSTTSSSVLARVRIAATSPIVWQLWIRLSLVLAPFSTFIQQIQMSPNQEEHARRFLNQFAAATLVRYMSTLLQFLQVCSDMQVHLSELSDWKLADILICGSMARKADGSGPRCSVAVKALRWACKQLEIPVLQPVFSAMVASFDKQKIPFDRREALPFPLFVVMCWEHRILQSQSTIKEVIILGGFLLL